jgi:SAM-dependent methyltransferase
VSRAEKARKLIEERVYRDAVGAPPEPKWKMLLALISEEGFATRVVRKRLNLPTPLNTTDRRVLEQQIFPEYDSDPAIRNVLFVGCNTYTAHYQREFFPNLNFATIEPDPALSRFGASCHVVAPLEELATHFPTACFDLIICNGVFGWGLDELDQCDAAFEQCHTCLTDNGKMLLGWDDVPRRTPIALEQIPSLGRFHHDAFPVFGSWRYLTDTPFRHTFDFYRK